MKILNLLIFIVLMSLPALASEPIQNQAWKAWTEGVSFQQSDSATVILQNISYEKAQIKPRIWAQHFAGGKWNAEEKLDNFKKAKLKPLATTKMLQPLQDLKPGIYRFLIFNRDDFKQPPAITNTFEIK